MSAPPLLLAALTVLTAVAAAGPASAGDPELQADLEVIAHRSIFFGHQSVGANILDGVRDLAATEGVPLRVVEVKRDGPMEGPMFGHGFMAENGNPALKLQSFESALAALPEAPDLAFLKLCFVDVGPSTDVRALFQRYQSVMRSLKAMYPRTTIVHFTVPLTAVQGGWKAALKRLLGRAPYGYLENVRREELNALLREAFETREPFFDLARIESTSPDGQVQTAEFEGRRVPVLASAYTDDGGHLNGRGRRRVAGALIRLLAAVPLRNPAAADATR